MKKLLNKKPEHCNNCIFATVDKNDDVNTNHYSFLAWVCKELENTCPITWYDCPFVDIEEVDYCVDCIDFYDCHFNEIPTNNLKQIKICKKENK